MYVIREVLHCKPGKVRPLVEKFKAMSKLNLKMGFPEMRFMTDFSGENYWTLVSEWEVASMKDFEEMMQAQPDAEVMKEFEAIMKDYHDLIDHGHREIYKIEA